MSQIQSTIYGYITERISCNLIYICLKLSGIISDPPGHRTLCKSLNNKQTKSEEQSFKIVHLLIMLVIPSCLPYLCNAPLHPTHVYVFLSKKKRKNLRHLPLIYNSKSYFLPAPFTDISFKMLLWDWFGI